MSTVIAKRTQFVGSDRLLAGIVLSVLTFWLFAQSVINVVPAMKSSLDISLETLTLAVSLSALFSGCFVVASGGLADKFGRMRMTTLGLGLSIVGSAMLVLSGTRAVPGRPGAAGLSAACIMPATLALIKTWYEGVRASGRSASGSSARGAAAVCARSSAGPSPPVWAGAGSSSSPLPSRCWRCFCCAARRKAAAPARSSISWTSAVC
jgi:MFS family permease